MLKGLALDKHYMIELGGVQACFNKTQTQKPYDLTIGKNYVNPPHMRKQHNHFRE